MTQPIEPFVRSEASPADAAVAVRGAPLTAAKFLEHAARQQTAFTYRRAPMIAVSVDLVTDGWVLERILRERLWSRSRYAITEVGRLRAAGFEVLATFSSPHHSVVWPDLSETTAAALLEQFAPSLVNQFRQGRRR